MPLRLSLLTTVMLAFGTPVWATPVHEHGQDHGHDHGHEHGMKPGAGGVAHTHQTVEAKGLKATFHFNAPTKAVFTCPMHPDVTSGVPGRCPTCKMALVKQTHVIAMTLEDAKKQAVTNAKVHLSVKDAGGMSQALSLTGRGYYQGAFALAKGTYTLAAHVTRPGNPTVELVTTYVVK